MNVMMRTAALGALAALGPALFPPAARADVERIREKALELEQKLNRQLVDVDLLGNAPNTARVYKDFDFILKRSKVDEVMESGDDFRARGLANYLIRALVESELAGYEDDLRSYLQTTTVDLDGRNLTYSDLLKRLAVTADGAERRKVASLLGPMVETSMVFRSDIANRRVLAYRAQGFADYADFYGQREGLDLAALQAEAESVIALSGTLYDTLFAHVARRHLGVEPRQVKFSDLAYLTQGAMFNDLFPGDAATRMKSVYRGLGVDLSGLVVDIEGRPGQAPGTMVLPVVIPGEVHVNLNPMGAERDADDLVYAVGEALLHARAKEPGLETAYLVNGPAAAAVAWIPRMVLGESGWIRTEAKGDPTRLAEYLEYRAFQELYELRALAGLTLFELHVYRGENPEKAFRDHFTQASGVRITQADSHRGLDSLSQLNVASRFRGLLGAAALRDQLSGSLGDAWYADGRAAAVLGALWSQGGTLTVDAVMQATGGVSNSPSRRIEQIRALATEAGVH